MRKALVYLTAMVLALTFTACNAPANNAGARDAGEYTVYPHDASDIILGMSKIEEPPKDIFTTPASENGKEGYIYKFIGEITEEKVSNGYNMATVKTDTGEMVLIDMYSYVVEQYPDLDLSEGASYFRMPKVGEKVCAYAEYSGYSDAIDAPTSFLGSMDALTHIIENALSECDSDVLEKYASGAESDASKSDLEQGGFDLNAYKTAVSECRDAINEAGVVISNVGAYESKVISALSSIGGSIRGDEEVKDLANKSFEWLAENADESRETVDAAYNTIRQQYKNIILTEIDGKEAEEIDSALRGMYDAYESIYNLVIYPIGSASAFEAELQGYIDSFINCDDDLSLFLDD